MESTQVNPLEKSQAAQEAERQKAAQEAAARDSMMRAMQQALAGGGKEDSRSTTKQAANDASKTTEKPAANAEKWDPETLQNQSSRRSLLSVGSLWERTKHLASEFAQKVKDGVETVENAVHKMTDAVILEATEVAGGLHAQAQKMEDRISKLATNVEKQFGNMESSAFDALYKLQNGESPKDASAVPAQGGTISDGVSTIDPAKTPITYLPVPGTGSTTASETNPTVASSSVSSTAQLFPASQNPVQTFLANEPAAAKSSTKSTSISADAGVGGYAQIRLAGKLPDVAEGLDLSGNIRATLPVLAAGSAGVSYAGQKKEVKLNLTGELDVGKGDSNVALTGGSELNFAITLKEGGGVRLDSVGLNGVVDADFSKVMTKVMKLFHGEVGTEAGIEMQNLQFGGDGVPNIEGDIIADAQENLVNDAASSTSYTTAQSALDRAEGSLGSLSEVGLGDVGDVSTLEDYELSDSESLNSFHTASSSSNPALSEASDLGSVADLGDVAGGLTRSQSAPELGGVPGGVPRTQSFLTVGADTSKVTQIEAALSLNWVNSDFSNKTPGFQTGWRHDGGAPDQLLLNAKAFLGTKALVGVESDAGVSANAQFRLFTLASAGFGFAFTDAGKNTFGKGLTQWAA